MNCNFGGVAYADSVYCAFFGKTLSLTAISYNYERFICNYILIMLKNGNINGFHSDKSTWLKRLK